MATTAVPPSEEVILRAYIRRMVPDALKPANQTYTYSQTAKACGITPDRLYDLLLIHRERVETEVAEAVYERATVPLDDRA